MNRYANGYGYFNYDPANGFRPLSRFDLWMTTAVLAFFALALGFSIPNAASAVELALRALLTLGTATGAALFFWGALRWGRPGKRARAATQQPLSVHRAIKKGDLDRHDRAA